MTLPAKRRARHGFTLIEALLALVLATTLFAGMAFYTSGWTRQWDAVMSFGAREDTVAIVLDRMVEEMEAAQPVLIFDAQSAMSGFEGAHDAVSFVRPALGFEPRAGLDRVTYFLGSAGGQPALIRLRRDHITTPVFAGAQTNDGEELPLLRGVTEIALSYAGADGAFEPEWRAMSRAPSIVRIELSGQQPRPWRRIAFARPRIDLPASCATASILEFCREITREKP